MSRALTPQEKQQARQIWPRLNVDAVVVTDEQTRRYNCLAWTLGITTSWVWPWGSRNATKSEFDALYRSHGFNPAAAGEIAAFGLNLNSMTHGSISGPGHGPRWESKCGAWLRIQHGLGELEGGSFYGNVLGFYTHRALLKAALAGEGATIQPMKLEESEAEAIKQKASAVSKDVTERFNIAYKAWVETWEHPLVIVSSNPSDRAQSTQFLELIALGPQIIPLLIERLATSDEFFTLQAIDRLLPASHLVSLELEDPRILGGEQERAAATVRRWLAING
jgi:hypothetical protein